MGRTDKKTVLEQIYKDFDYAAENLPADNNSALTRVDRGCALAFKARIALYQADYETAADGAKACIDLGKYSLYPDYGELFRDKTKNCEIIWSIPHSTDIEVDSNGKPTTQSVKSFIARSAGGTHDAQPSWELLASYEMTMVRPLMNRAADLILMTLSRTATRVAVRLSLLRERRFTETLALTGILLLPRPRQWIIRQAR